MTPTAAGYAIDQQCAINGMTVTSTGTVSGDFASSYRVSLSTKMSGANIPVDGGAAVVG